MVGGLYGGCVTSRRLRAVPMPPGPIVPDPPLHPRRVAVVGYRLRVRLDGIEPEIWRRVDVPSDVTVDLLHLVLQAVMGWDDAHLHGFARGVDFYGAAPGNRFVMDDDGLEGVHEAAMRIDEVLAKPGETLSYLYDFGDDWEHEIRLEEVVEAPDVTTKDLPAVLLDGARACPPEDCGGVPGYLELWSGAAALARGEALEEWPAERHEIMFGTVPPEEALAGFEEFDVGAAQALLDGVAGAGLSDDVVALARQAHDPSAIRALAGLVGSGPVPVLSDEQVAAAVGHFAWFLEHLGDDGVALTSAGFLRPADVVAVAERLDLGREWVGTLNRESHTPQVTEFREAAQALGLVRKAKGRLALTAVGRRLASAGPRELWDHIASRLPVVPRGRAATAGYDAAMLVLLRAAGSGEWLLDAPPGEWVPEPDPLLVQAFASLGWSYGGVPARSIEVHRLAGPTGVVLTRMGGYEPERSGWSGRPTAVGRALARAVLAR